MVEAKRVLLVDDEPKIVEVLERYLTDEGFIVSKAHDGARRWSSSSSSGRIVIFDLKLPDMSGIDVFHAVRSSGDTPILMLTSRTDEVDRIIGLELGADDYITKPFSPREVVARVKTVLRRLERSQPGGSAQADDKPASNRLVVGSLTLDPDKHEVRIDGKVVTLTPTEFRILEALAAQPGRTFTRTQLLDRASAEDLEVFDRTLDRHIANLRHKIESNPRIRSTS